MRRDREPYESLLRSVAYQQLHGKAAEAILARLIALFPDHPFPPPHLLLQRPPEDLRRCGLSAAKVAAMRDIAAKTLDGAVPDLIMLDITMPGMNGWEVARAIRARGLDEVMILMVSAEAKELTAPPRDDPPHDDYLIKPFNLADLFERLETLLDLEWRYAAETAHDD